MEQLNNPKAIFLDMDGTILNHANQITIKTKEIIATIRNKGIPVFIATGRSSGEIFQLAPQGFEVDGIVSSNGMTTYFGEKKLEQHYLPKQLVELVIEKAQEKQVYYELFPTEGSRIALQQDYSILAAETEGPKPASVGINEWVERKEAMNGNIEWCEILPAQHYSKFYCFSKQTAHIDNWKETLDELKRSINFTTSASSAHNVEIMVANVNKATGIKAILNQLAIDPADILVMGDSYNDVPMFQLAGQTVAMKNADREIQDMTNEVTTYTCDEDGVYHYLNERFIKNKW
ncbi:5-amino-6-(5-phospho-D-ribitylamino)uracil phosphatase YwtE [Paraliobacillus ryukyuensis]|uniref:Cof subfamily protein (Haloacid dehalogenase superfamily)/HAD superfamily hydrolase (TIGR01484 family) n=1 Tax=Paraliobacillus ryukyuensis TaxID=200904 RepID=A0A366EDH5_9BACI|nr:HAD family hydrolase [Paraliobacillus ryukyuensis]RBP00432.1 hypothetical protein DES48_102194 [Paraliobacillus ryukyuensis]